MIKVKGKLPCRCDFCNGDNGRVIIYYSAFMYPQELRICVDCAKTMVGELET